MPKAYVQELGFTATGEPEVQFIKCTGHMGVVLDRLTMRTTPNNFVYWMYRKLSVRRLVVVLVPPIVVQQRCQHQA